VRFHAGFKFIRLTAGIISNDLGGHGAVWADYDNDAWLDLMVTVGPEVRLYRNTGNGAFTRSELVVDDSEFAGCSLGDYDNDGFLDLFAANRTGNNVLWHNDGNGTFTRISTGCVVNDGGDSWGAAWGDCNDDGFLDLFVANRSNQNDFLYMASANGNHWLTVRLVGTRSNRTAIGAKVLALATIGGTTRRQLRQVSAGGSMGADAMDAHFGLGGATTVDLIRIEWPSGMVQEFSSVQADRALTIYEPPLLEITFAEPFGYLEMVLTSRGGYDYDIEATEDFSLWTRIGGLTNVNGSVQFVDETAGPRPHRFYRAVMVP